MNRNIKNMLLSIFACTCLLESVPVRAWFSNPRVLLNNVTNGLCMTAKALKTALGSCVSSCNKCRKSIISFYFLLAGYCYRRSQACAPKFVTSYDDDYQKFYEDAAHLELSTNMFFLKRTGEEFSSYDLAEKKSTMQKYREERIHDLDRESSALTDFLSEHDEATDQVRQEATNLINCHAQIRSRFITLTE